MGVVYKTIGEYDKAIELYKQALTISRELEAKHSIGIQLGNLGDLFYLVNKWGKAKEHLKQSIQIFRSIKFPLGRSVFQASLALILAQEGHIDEALNLLSKDREVIKVHRLEYGKYLCKEAMVFHIAQRFDEAEQNLDDAIETAKLLKVKSNSELAKHIKRSALALDRHSIAEMLESIEKTAPTIETS